MKYQQLKKRLLLESGMIVGGLIIMAAIAFFLDDFSGNYQQSCDVLEGKVQAITATTTALSNQYDNVKRNSALLEKITQIQSEDGFDINPQIAKNRFNHLRDQYYLTNLHLSMSPITEMQDASYRRATNVIISSDVSISFEGLSDEYAYSLLNTIQQDLPGSSKIINLTLTRKGEITSDMLRTISEKGTAALIGGELKFMWFGVKPIEHSDSVNAAKKP